MTWNNAHGNCLLCRMEKKTEWYLETEDWVVAEKLGGGPFVVYKTHKKQLSEEEWDEMEETVARVFDDFEVDVRMGMVPNHWHGHIIPSGKAFDLTNE